MAKKQTALVEALTAAQRATATKVFREDIKAESRRIEVWAPIRAMFMVAGQEVTPLKQELSALYKQEYITYRRALKGSELTLDEVDAAKKTATEMFSRGVRDPDAKKKARAAKTTTAKTATEPAKTDAGASQPAPSMVANLEQLATRCKSINEGLVAFQNHVTAAKVHLPELGIGALGTVSHEAAKMAEEIAAILAAFKS